MKQRNVNESFTAPLDLVEAVEALAARKGASKAELYRDAVQKYMESHPE